MTKYCSYVGKVGLSFELEQHSGLLPMAWDSFPKIVRKHAMQILIPIFDTLIGIETWRIMHPQRILHAPDAISVHGGALPGESRNRVLRSRAQCSANKAIAAQ